MDTFFGKNSVELLYHFFDQIVVVTKFYIPFQRLCFYFADCSFCCANAFELDVVPLVNFYFCYFCFDVISQKVIVQTSVKELLSRFVVVAVVEVLRFHILCYIFNPCHVIFVSDRR